MIFDRAIKNQSRDSPGVSVTPVTGRLDDLQNWMVNAPYSMTNATRAMKISTANACIEILSNSMSKYPYYVLDGRTKERVQHPLSELIERRPNEAMSPSQYKKLVEVQRLTCGNAYVYVNRSRLSARPEELIPLPPRCVAVDFDEDGNLWYRFTHPNTGRTWMLRSWDVIHLKAYSDDGIHGISVLERASEVLATAEAAQRYENRLYTQNAQPAGVLTIDSVLDKEKKNKVRQEWHNIYGGADNAFRVAVLDLGMKYQAVSLSNRDTQFVESKDVSVEDITRFFGVPLYKVNSGKQSYSSNEQNAIEFVTGTMQPTVTQYEEEYSYKLLFDSELRKGLEVRVNMMAELRGDHQSRGAWYKNMRDTGAFSVDDIRALEDMPPVPGGDVRLASLNYVPLEDFRRLSVARNDPQKGGVEDGMVEDTEQRRG